MADAERHRPASRLEKLAIAGSDADALHGRQRPQIARLLGGRRHLVLIAVTKIRIEQPLWMGK